ncbi:MAG: hypothetical protein IKU29_06420, partial [Parabacteroides sp.]|nr:hypothetical protein [Parabacteroides sp.]
MKSLNEYIKESILDVDDLVADDSQLIKQWIQKNCRTIDKYTIKDNIVNVDGDVILSVHVKEIPFQFGEVTGSFQCMSTLMTNLKGSPRKCGAFYCNYCSHLTSLEGAPEECN